VTQSVDSPLAEYRRARGLTRAELANLAGVTRMTVYLLETGKVSGPRMKTAVAIAKALGCDPAELFEMNVL
jgi:DNA-binding XRE family transcriptional regulator